MERQDLWNAYPDGYVARRGLRTIAGWQCVAVGTESLWLPPLSTGTELAPVIGLPKGGPPYENRSQWRDDMESFRLAADLGEFLPHVDPDDPATWKLLLAEFALAMRIGIGVIDMNVVKFSGYAWTSTRNHDSYSWQLNVFTVDGRRCTSCRFDELQTSDASMALVRARAQIRSGFIAQWTISQLKADQDI